MPTTSGKGLVTDRGSTDTDSDTDCGNSGYVTSDDDRSLLHTGRELVYFYRKVSL